MEFKTEKTLRSGRDFRLKYFLVCWLGGCFILAGIFYQNIQHQKRMDAIFDKYQKDMDATHETKYKK